MRLPWPRPHIPYYNQGRAFYVPTVPLQHPKFAPYILLLPKRFRAHRRPIPQLRPFGVQSLHNSRIVRSRSPHLPHYLRSLPDQIRPYFQFQPRRRTSPPELAVPPKGKRPQRADTATAFPQYVNGLHYESTGVTAPPVLGISSHRADSSGWNLRCAPPQRFGLIAQGAHQSSLPIKASQRRLVLPIPIFGVFHKGAAGH